MSRALPLVGYYLMDDKSLHGLGTDRRDVMSSITYGNVTLTIDGVTSF